MKKWRENIWNEWWVSLCETHHSFYFVTLLSSTDGERHGAGCFLSESTFLPENVYQSLLKTATQTEQQLETLAVQ
ncbi:MAG TPA: hypothetical protein EYP59_16335 [Thiotrichaceae bacterium]|nr:hypothetical protein [Thiotrichaceae bacterium]